MPTKVIATLKLTTAMFLHGPGKAAEVRAGAIKSAARYWWRAAIGDAVQYKCDGSDSCECIHCREGRIFGSTVFGKGIVFRASGCDRLASAARNLLPHHPRDGKGLDHPSPSNAMKAGQEFRVEVFPSHPTMAVEEVDAAVAALWLAVHLGGFGQRSRRGAGSVALKGLEPNRPGLPLAESHQSVEALRKHLEEGVSTARRAIRRGLASHGGLGSARPPFSMLRASSADDSQIQVVALKESKDEEAARAEVMRGLRGFKSALLGLPYMKPRSGEPKITGSGVRHASPLWIHLETLLDGTFVAVQTLMRSSSIESAIRPHGSHRNPPPEWSRVDDYLRSCNGQTVQIR